MINIQSQTSGSSGQPDSVSDAAANNQGGIMNISCTFCNIVGAK